MYEYCYSNLGAIYAKGLFFLGVSKISRIVSVFSSYTCLPNCELGMAEVKLLVKLRINETRHSK